MQLRDRLAYAGVARGRLPPRPKTAVALPRGFKTGRNRLGEVHYRDQYWSLDHRHGEYELAAALDLDPVLADRLAPGLPGLDLRAAAFLDIETTGLSGGTGTYAFLVGLGTFEAFSFRVRQFFLADPSGEAAMLSELTDALDRRGLVVTYNGKSFDLPQLATRYTLSRLLGPLQGMFHIDLLHPARRLFGRRLESCRLADVEREVLGLRRPGDVPSWLIPGLYFAFIRRRDLAGLHPVFEHNTLDVLSLPSLLAALNSAAGAAAEGDAAHLLALGRWDEQRGRLQEAASLYRRAWLAESDPHTGGEAAWRLARLLRREGAWDECAAVWRAEEASAASIVRVVRARVELAKMAEHRDRDLPRALTLARAAAALLQRHPSVARSLPRTNASLAHRLARLERRTASASLGRQAPG
ncbi:MAG TPA: ribonuclease H-like domain-containing protein [Dehalococcoidia bacterium]|nr:ribonuclease H-like domain-containing protein [Dehalococcoidia bacterium]